MLDGLNPQPLIPGPKPKSGQKTAKPYAAYHYAMIREFTISFGNIPEYTATAAYQNTLHFFYNNIPEYTKGYYNIPEDNSNGKLAGASRKDCSRSLGPSARGPK